MSSADSPPEKNHCPSQQHSAHNAPWTLNDLDELIIVCCHAIWLGGPTKGQDEYEWLIEDFQNGETPTFIEHMNCALRLLESQPNAMVVFSGGATKLSKTPLSEGQSYLNLALALQPHLALPPHQHTLHAECFATESYQNVLFSLILFRRLTHHYPARITLISHDFKRARFLELHIPAIRWPKDRVDFIGIDPPEAVTQRRWLEDEERKKGWEVWKRDLYGRGESVGRKRRERGWKDEVEGIVGEGCEQGVRGLLGWDGGRTRVEIFGGALPWDEDGGTVAGAKEEEKEQSEIE